MRALVLLLGALLGRKAQAHMNSVMSNLDWPYRRRLDDGSAPESPNLKWQCPEGEVKSDHNNYHLRGVNLGSWMVLEPWITPSLFFQFLGKSVEGSGLGREHVGMDMYSFCSALGPEEGNAQLRRHWATWITETDIAQLATIGINTVRLPVGDWMYKPYGPYIGCTDGSLEEVERLFALCRRYNMRVMLDLHAVTGSQNGFDNSGQSMDLEWTTFSQNFVTGTATFVHWPYRAARWLGDFDRTSATYKSKSDENINHTLAVLQTMVDMYWNESAVMGLEPVNEPWQFSPWDWLKEFYWQGYNIVRSKAPNWLYLVHDSFRFDPYMWGDFLKNCPNVGLDTHIYQAWLDPGPQATYLASACDIRKAIRAMEDAGIPVVVGEWSLATDNCVMWLNGFNDNLPGFPRVQCDYTRCPLPYMGSEQPGAPPNPLMPPVGPFGTGSSTPSFGMCPVDKHWKSESLFFRSLARAKLYAFDEGHGWFFWNWKTELSNQWNYLAATELGWFPARVDHLDRDKRILSACDRFTGREAVPGMPPGVFAAFLDRFDLQDDDAFAAAAWVVASAVGVAFLAVMAVRRRRQLQRRGRGWQEIGVSGGVSGSLNGGGGGVGSMKYSGGGMGETDALAST